jgi:hypothetical protein
MGRRVSWIADVSFACRPNSSAANLTGNYSGATANSTRSSQSTNCSLTINSDGTFSYSIGPGVDNSSGFPAYWYTPTSTGIGANYTVKLTVNSGTTPGGSIGSFVSLPQTWTLSTTPGILKTGVCTLAIGDSGGANTVETGTVTLTSDSS